MRLYTSRVNRMVHAYKAFLEVCKDNKIQKAVLEKIEDQIGMRRCLYICYGEIRIAA